MKYWEMLFAAGIGILAACSEINEIDCEKDTFLDEEDFVERVIFEAPVIRALGDDDETRASLSQTGDDAIRFAWESTDIVGIYPNKGAQVYFEMADGVGTNVASFDGGGWALRKGYTYSCYYPLVSDMFLDRNAIPVSFANQEQKGVTDYEGVRFYLASEGTSAESGTLRFTFQMLNTVIRIKAIGLPAGTYSKLTLTTDEPLFVQEGTFGLEDMTITGKTSSKTLEVALKDFTLTEASTEANPVLIYLTSAPVDLRGHTVTIRVYSEDGSIYTCDKTPGMAYEAQAWGGLKCTMEESPIIEFEDDIFKAYCVEHFDTNGDGEISITEVMDVTAIAVDNKGITSMRGVEYFRNLTELQCSDNQLIDLDVSSNTALRSLNCRSNQLIDLDVSNNPALIWLHCDDNQLTNLDVSSNTALTWFTCDDNQLTSLDMSANTALTYLHCNENQLISLDVSNNIVLEELICQFNQLTSLDVSNNLALKRLYCGQNQLASLDVSNNPALIWFSCETNQLVNLDVSNNPTLTELVCSANQLTSLDVSNNPALIWLHCDDNQLTSLDVSNNPALTNLQCGQNLLTSLDVSNNPALISLYCSQNSYLSEIWMKAGQSIIYMDYDTDVATIKYKD